jgi:hypothetical protein
MKKFINKKEHTYLFMKTEISIFIIIVLILAFNISSAYADVIEPGKKNIILSYKISNINSYPNYVFLLHGNPSPSYEILNSSEFSFYKLSTASIYAVKQSKFNQKILNQNNQTAVDNYFKDDANVIHSSLVLDGSYGTVDQNNQLNGALIVLEIVSLNDTTLELKKSKIIFSFTDGSTHGKAFKSDNSTPDQTKNINLIDYLWYLILPLLAAIALLVILIPRRRGSV